MMTIEQKLKMYRDKKAFIAGISAVFQNNPAGHSVTAVEYELFHKEVDGNHYFNEWAIVRFDGGGWSPCRISGNSNTANFRAIGEMIDGGYYEEKQWYEKQFEVGFKRVNLAKLCLTEE